MPNGTMDDFKTLMAGGTDAVSGAKLHLTQGALPALSEPDDWLFAIQCLGYVAADRGVRARLDRIIGEMLRLINTCPPRWSETSCQRCGYEKVHCTCIGGFASPPGYRNASEDEPERAGDAGERRYELRQSTDKRSPHD